VRIVYLSRYGEGLVPDVSTVIQEGDLVHVMLESSDLPRVEEAFMQAPGEES
jgi:trk system potassium uptake protein TrkA